MPQDFLRKITDLPMPQTFGDQASIDKILVLVAAEMVIATLPNTAPSRSPKSTPSCAI